MKKSIKRNSVEIGNADLRNADDSDLYFACCYLIIWIRFLAYYPHCSIGRCNYLRSSELKFWKVNLWSSSFDLFLKSIETSKISFICQVELLDTNANKIEQQSLYGVDKCSSQRIWLETANRFSRSILWNSSCFKQMYFGLSNFHLQSFKFR